MLELDRCEDFETVFVNPLMENAADSPKPPEFRPSGPVTGGAAFGKFGGAPIITVEDPMGKGPYGRVLRLWRESNSIFN